MDGQHPSPEHDRASCEGVQLHEYTYQMKVISSLDAPYKGLKNFCILIISRCVFERTMNTKTYESDIL